MDSARRNEYFLKHVVGGDDVARARQLLKAHPSYADADWGARAMAACGLCMAGDADEVEEEEDGTTLHLACADGSLNVAALLLENGADPNASNCNGRRPLCFAAHRGHLQVVKLLLQSGADPNSGNSRCGHPPLVSALHNDASWSEDFALAYVELLVEHGANVNQAGPNGTPLHCAARHGPGRIVKLLISRAADINAQTVEQGATALHLVLSRRSNGSAGCAERTETAEMVTLLVESGADTNAKDRQGLTPLQCAENQDDMEALALMS